MAPSVALTGAEVRAKFVEFFEKKYAHTHVVSSSVIPHEDPTLLFANAGMNQFKPIFLGTADPQSDMAKWKRACNSQKCIRAGGKHNDLDDVGKDVYHHTFFEMLGNWSFGDYFKKEAIAWAWELLTVAFGLPKERLYVTYFGGNASSGLDPDTEARDLWISAGIPAERVLPFGMKENFWEMGETGPCGPCSEIHFDRIGGRDASALVNMDDPDVLEIWNLVFIQFNREPDSSLRQLPSKHVDTGMGLERVVSVLQDKRSNYDTDLFTPIFAEIQRLTGARAYTGLVGKDDVDGLDMAYRVVADHIRTLTIAITDGGLPGNTGRNYVLRRILRRAIRYCAEKLNAKPGVFASLVHTVVAILGDAFPSLRRNPQYVVEIINEEEQQFRRTLDRGRRLFERELTKITDGIIPGTLAWTLYDTYGFPYDLTEIMASEKNMKIDKVGYAEAESKAREASKGHAEGAAQKIVLDVHAITALKNKGTPATDDAPKHDYTKDESGNYAFPDTTARVLAVYQNGAFVDNASAGVVRVGVVLDRTNMYAEQGGQTYDVGSLIGKDDAEIAVEDVQVYGGYVLHVGLVKQGSISVGDSVTVSVDGTRRRPVMSNHTATHMLNYALLNVLGTDVDQKGSLVAADKLRFDFSCGKPLSSEQLKRVQDVVTNVAAQNGTVYKKEVPLAVAKQIFG
eukprot:Opistho-2@79664